MDNRQSGFLNQRIPGAILLLMTLCGAAIAPGNGICDQGSMVKVGLGETVITPQTNLQMGGFARSMVSTGVHDDLHARISDR